jgi:hypothetical protein
MTSIHANDSFACTDNNNGWEVVDKKKPDCPPPFKGLKHYPDGTAGLRQALDDLKHRKDYFDEYPEELREEDEKDMKDAVKIIVAASTQNVASTYNDAEDEISELSDSVAWIMTQKGQAALKYFINGGGMSRPACLPPLQHQSAYVRTQITNVYQIAAGMEKVLSSAQSLKVDPARIKRLRTHVAAFHTSCGIFTLERNASPLGV